MTLGSKPDALDLSLADWQAWAQEHRFAPFVGKQIFEWIFSKQVLDPERFSNISKPVREQLGKFSWQLPEVSSHLISKDGAEKFLLKTRGNLLFEMVLMPYENRTTLCISSQVGCKMACTFCQTGKMGFQKNLSSGEILSQLLIASLRLKESGAGRITNVVFMGMGEPLDNYDEVVKACRILLDPLGFALSPARVTISTAGLVPEIERLGRELPVRLAISLHSASDEKRSQMMPINRRYNLEELKKVLLDYPAPKRLGITFEYVMIEGVNDSLQDAKRLVGFLHGLKAKVNLIPINHFPGVAMQASREEKLSAFQSYLAERSIPAPVRYSRGQDISGGCGQLAAKKADELGASPIDLARKRREEKRS